ncbi:MAG: hypothetical protein WBP81_03255 [Solirubrobacteraceae bacterium]
MMFQPITYRGHTVAAATQRRLDTEPSRLVLQASAPDLRALWAVGVGNEQDLTSTNRNAQGTSTGSGHGRTAGENYRADWNAVEPVLVKLAPHAIRVYDEFSRWTFIANKQGSRQAARLRRDGLWFCDARARTPP